MKTISVLSKGIYFFIVALLIVSVWGFRFGYEHVSAWGMNSEVLASTPTPTPIPTIYKSGTITSNELWTSLNLYVIYEDFTVAQGVTLTIEPNTIIKFYRDDNFYNSYINVFGTLKLPDSPGNEVIFTSWRDDSYGGDTNGDGENTLPAPGDWGGVYLHNSSTTFQNAIVRYGFRGLGILSDQFSDINPPIIHNTFEQNIYGVTLVTYNDKNITSQIQNNVFAHNNFGLFTYQETINATGTALPTLMNNEFNNNTRLPIYLGGSAFLKDDGGNTFIGSPTPSQKLGIGISGRFNYNGTWGTINGMPYVILGNTTIDAGTTLTVPAGSVIKFDQGQNLVSAGTLNLQSTSSNPIIFTSFRDDSVGGDTNGDGSDLEPLPGDWNGLYIKTSASAITYVTLKYSSNGMVVWNDTTKDINPSIKNSIFDKNIYGIQLLIYSTGNITSLIQGNQITNNQFGLVASNPGGVTGTSLPVLTSNNFTGNTSLPIYLAGSAFPTYSGNTFGGYPTASQRLGIGLNGIFTQSGTWPIVNAMPYVVLGNTTVAAGNIVTLPQDSIVKFNSATYLDIKGGLILQGVASHLITFTSFKDDMGGDTNGDGSSSQPAPGDWNTIYLENDDTVFTYNTVKYGTTGLTIYNATPDTFNLNISHNSFSLNQTGINFQTTSNGINQGNLANNSISLNQTGIIFQITSNGINQETLANNSISLNQTGIYFQSTSNGINQETLNNNSIIGSTGFPVILNGTAFPSYSNNTFASNHYPAIALSGSWYASGTWPYVIGDNNQVFPYVVISADIGGISIKPGSNVTVPAGTVFKITDQSWIEVQGTFTLQSTTNNPIIFTSFEDDSVKGDTNSDGTSSKPEKGNWSAIILESSSTNFHDAEVRYSDHGVLIYNTSPYDIAPTIQYSDFEQNNFGIFIQTTSSGVVTSVINNNVFKQNNLGVYLYIKSSSNITPDINNNLFDHNQYGLGTYAESGDNTGISMPNLSNNTFSNSSGYPIYLNGTAQPVYSGNTFTNNTHPAIGLGGYWNASVTWDKVNGDNNQTFPYVVEQSIVQSFGATVTVPSGLILKFNRDTYLYVYGLLNLQSDVTNPVIFTSYFDDTYAGDTNADGGATKPHYADWKTIWLIDSPSKINHLANFIAKYATAAIGIYYDGPDNTEINTSVDQATFSQNLVGMVTAIGWVDPNTCSCSNQGAGNIIATIGANPNDTIDTIFDGNQYGLVTYAHSNSTGYSAPTLDKVQFNKTQVYPIFLGGTSFPIFHGVTINGTPQSSPSSAGNSTASTAGTVLASLDISFPDSPGVQALRTDEMNAAAMPSPQLQPADLASCDLTITSPSPQAIGLGGVFNNSGTLCQIDNLPYAVVGGYPLVITINGVQDPVNASLIIGNMNASGSALTLMPGTVLKFGPGLYADAKGKLDLQGTMDKPVIFTSIKDDSVGGDTNRDGSKSTPKKSDWQAVYLESSATAFTNAVVEYAQYGLYIYFNGPINTNINPSVAGNILTNNLVGLTMCTPGSGDIMSDIHGNLFMNNDTDISGQLNANSNCNPSVGRLMVNIHDNDLLGPTSFGVNNLSTNYTILAQSNYWGDPSGPKHNTNPNGKGVPVSDRVDFSNWRTAPSFTKTYSVQGRVVSNDPIPVGLSGVIIHLSNGAITSTNSGGYFSFNNLTPGNYGVMVTLSGYAFNYEPYAVTVPPDATVPTFIATPSTQPTYSISGQVLELQHLPVPGLIITLDSGASTVTDRNGKYSFTNVPVGTYVVTPTSDEYTFTPPTLTVTINGTTGNATGNNFTLNAKIGTPKFVFLPMLKR